MGTIYTSTSDKPINAAKVATVNTPSSGTITMVAKRIGSFVSMKFTLVAAQIAVTDGAASGSHGSLKLADLVEGSWMFLASRVDFTAYSPDGTGVPDDAVFDIGVGTLAIAAAADGVLTADALHDNIAIKVDQTLSGGTTTGTAVDPCVTAVDGTTTAQDINLNWSGTAATIDDDGTIDVTGTIEIVAAYLGDD